MESKEIKNAIDLKRTIQKVDGSEITTEEFNKITFMLDMFINEKGFTCRGFDCLITEKESTEAHKNHINFISKNHKI